MAFLCLLPNADKRKAVLTLLNDEEWSGWSDREIARKCAVSHEFVRQRRASLSTVDSENDSRTYKDKHGNESKMNTSNIGTSNPSKIPERFDFEPIQSNSLI